MIRYGAQGVAALLIALLAAPPAFAQSVDAVRPGATQSWESVTPPSLAGAPTTGQIDVRTDPSRAKVFLDKKEHDDTTHTTLQGVLAGPHFLLLARDNLETGVWVKVIPDQTTSVFVDLHPFDTRPGHPSARATTVEVSSVPSNASVEVDGRPLGKTPLVAVLAWGKHDILVGMNGHHPAELVMAEGKDYATLNANLTPVSTAEQSYQARRIVFTVLSVPFFAAAALAATAAVFAHAGPENDEQKMDNQRREDTASVAAFGYALAGFGLLYLATHGKPAEDPASRIQVSAIMDSTGRPLAPALAWHQEW